MALNSDNRAKIDEIERGHPQVSIFLQPIAPPAALGLAGFAGSTWITATWIAGWWGTSDAPTIFFPYVMLWGGLGQFIAGLYGFAARDVLVTVIHCLWGSFWMAIGLLYLLVAVGSLPAHGVHEHFVELGAWMSVNMAFTWVGAIAALSRDFTLFLVLFFLATGSTIATAGWYQYGTPAGHAVKAAAYFWIASSICAWWRVTCYMLEEAFGKKYAKFYPVFRTSIEKTHPLIQPGIGEPGVKRGMPGFA